VHLSISLRILGLLLTLFSVAMLPPLLIAVLADDDTVTGFLSAFGITLISGLLLWLPLRRVRRELLIRDGFLVTALFWSVLGVFGSLPFMLSESLQLAPVDAVFESISGLTTTGATVLTGLDDMRRRSCSTAICCSGWAASASSWWRWRCCRCSASAACSCIAPRRRALPRTAS
jgi:trk system potassium uptake protein TrkH